MVVRFPVPPAAERRRQLDRRDHGRVMTEREYLHCADRPGYISEIIDGVVHVSPSARPSHFWWSRMIVRHLERFTDEHPNELNFVATDNDVIVPNRPGATRPRPDVAAYHDFPGLASIVDDDDWARFSPRLVVELISRRRARKDTFRNAKLYWLVPEIVEYWIVDPRKSLLEPALIVNAREAGRPSWVEYSLAFGEPWESKAIPQLQVGPKELATQAGWAA